MPKLYFRYATMGAAKTANLLMEDFQYTAQGKRSLVFKSAVDTRFGHDLVKSRVRGLSRKADALIAKVGDATKAYKAALEQGPVHCIFFDEVHFSKRTIIEELRLLAFHVPIICYGLRTDWKLNLFEGSAALFALADEIHEIKSTCGYWHADCNRKSFSNTKHRNRQPVTEGPQIELGAEDSYVPMCFSHHHEFQKWNDSASSHIGAVVATISNELRVEPPTAFPGLIRQDSEAVASPSSPVAALPLIAPPELSLVDDRKASCKRRREEVVETASATAAISSPSTNKRPK
jgi:thymidine kinase